MPRITPHYGLWHKIFKIDFNFFDLAVKCNDDINVIKLLAYLGAGFDCASKGEIKKVMDLGVSCKQCFLYFFHRENILEF